MRAQILTACLFSITLPAMAGDVFDDAARLLESKCLECHSPDTRKGELSLATREGFLEGGKHGPAGVAGSPDDSRLILAVSSREGRRPSMPRGRDPLAPEEVAALRAWISAGAPWREGRTLHRSAASGAEAWWSLRPLRASPVPAGDSDWPRTPVDAFVLSKLREKGLSPSPEADRRTLIRRLSFDLLGLPPDPEEVESFAADPDPRAYERLVDRLLTSPAYGERWGRHWLDVVHFGETHGYDKDKLRPNAWPYRDYVIRAFNEDRHYARFVEEQLAGDVLHPEDPQAVVATGFIASGPWDFVGHVELREGTVDKQITRTLDRDDMVMTAISTFASTTVHCARCHDHKFDPIPREDYYRLQAVFAGIDRGDRPYDPDPEVHRRRRAISAEIEACSAHLKPFEERIAGLASAELRGLDGRLKEIADRQAALAEAQKPPAAGAEEKSPSNGYHSAVSPSPDAVKWVQVDLGGALPLRSVRLVPARPTDFADTPGFGFPLRYKVEAGTDLELRDARMLADHTAADVPSPGDRPVEISGDGAPARFVRVTATRLWKRTEDYVFALAELEVAAVGTEGILGAEVTALDSIEEGRWGRRYLVDGFSSRGRRASVAEIAAGEERARRLTADLEALRADRERLIDTLLGAGPAAEKRMVERRLAEARKALAALGPPSLVYAAVPLAEGSRPVHLLERGDVKRPGAAMAPGALSALPDLEGHFQLAERCGEGDRRAALARWLLDPRNPLSWRSIVNRIWQYHFGRGLVDTPGDFGRMGSQPTHPELLDFLAIRFRDGGGSMKDLHRLLLSSAVYRQASADRPDMARVDGGDLFLWRMNRSRLEAEAIRDAVLWASGRLDRTAGGPSARLFFFKDDHSPVYDYARFDVNDPAAARRSVYRFIVRSVPDPFMDCLDCPDPSLLTPRRYATLTAQQALALLNDRFMIREAERFADRLESEASTPEARLERAYRLALGRPPAAREAELLLAHVRDHGLASACRLIFNLNEFIFID
jgi:uncharacterized protein DUF1553/uncharacterized protein DUF1549/cytochrome c